MPSFLYRVIDKIVLFTWGHWPARLLTWLTCDCRSTSSIVSFHGDGNGGWICDICGRKGHR